MNTYSYTFNGNLYLNITNKCMMACPFCMKYKWEYEFEKNDLKLEKEPSSDEVINSIDDVSKYGEIIFCGYGDALARPDAVVEIAKYLKNKGAKIRINTAGLANRYHGKNILPQLKDIIDTISISLNGTNAKEHNKINNPMFKEESFDEIISFAKESKKYIPNVVITAVEFSNLNILKIKEIADSIGVNFRTRSLL